VIRLRTIVSSACRVVVAVVAVLFCPALARPGEAAEGEKALGAGLDYSAWNVEQPDHPGNDHDSITAQGAQLVGDYEYGWNDTLWLRASLRAGYHVVPDGTAWSTGGTIGITYAFDVLRYVPYGELGIGVLAVGGDGLFTEVRPVVELGLGLDVLEGRTWSWGVVAHFDGTYSQALFFTIGPRVSWRWGYF
jgi:hypothetical protein